MTGNEHKRRLTNNEAVFRKWNETVYGIDKDTEPSSLSPTITALFLCECSDENCDSKISMSYREFGIIHATSQQFMVIPGHQVNAVETVVQETPSYFVVHKKSQPTNSPDKLQRTLVDNT